MKTTREERNEIAEAIDSARKVSPGEVSRLLADADRLARLEDGIRALADELQGEVEQHNPNKSFDEYSGGLADKAEMIEDQLRALMDGE